MIRWYALAAILWLTVSAVAQQPYVSERYQIAIDRNQFIGTVVGYDEKPVDLAVNIAQPINDGASSRPLVVWVHGGGFFDGNRDQLQPLIERWAKRGYVAVSPSYRLGFHGNLIGPPFAYDEAELIRACVRAVQDVWGSVRYMAKRAADYRIDTSRIVLAGISAGALTVMHMAMVDPSDQLPPQIRAIADAVRYGTAYKRPDLGPITGTLHTDVPTPSVKAVINVMGGLLSLDYLSGSPLPPTYSYHQTEDPIVPCGAARAYHGAPLNISATNPVVYGSCAITEEFERMGRSALQYKSWMWQGANHDIHDVDALDLDAAQFVAGVMNHPVSVAELAPQGIVFPADVITLRGEVIARAQSQQDVENLADGVYGLVQESRAVLCVKVGLNLSVQF